MSMVDDLAARAAYIKAFDEWCGPQAEALVRVVSASLEVERILRDVSMPYSVGSNIMSILKEMRQDTELAREWMVKEHHKRQGQEAKA